MRPREEIEVPAVRRGPVVLRVFLREPGKVGAGFRLLQDFFRLRANRRFVLAFCLQENVARADLFRRQC